MTHDDHCDSDPCDEYDLCEWIYGFAKLFVNEFNLHIHISRKFPYSQVSLPAADVVW